MPRDNRPLLVSLLGTGFLLALVAANDPLARPRPTELLPAGTDAQGDEFRRPDVLPVYDFARLAPAIAGLLDGKRARFRVAHDSPPSERVGCVCYGCATPDDMERTLFLRGGEADRGGLEVEAVLRVIHHPPAVCGKTAFVGFTEYRLVDAERVEP
jgi:hypothetical protein